MIDAELYEIAKQRLSYDPESGHLTWLAVPYNMTKRLGTRAGYQKMDGYRYLRINQAVLLEHRVIWFMQYGFLPDQIDHINAVRCDNRLCNLRHASNAENSRNKGRQSNNTSGYKGVTYNKAVGKYQAKICTNKKSISLGYFVSPQDAHQAYIKASGELHGQFGRS